MNKKKLKLLFKLVTFVRLLSLVKVFFCGSVFLFIQFNIHIYIYIV